MFVRRRLNRPATRRLLHTLAALAIGCLVWTCGARWSRADDSNIGFLGTVMGVSPEFEGVVITRIIPHTSAALSELRSGDVVQSINGLKVKTPEAMKKQIDRHRPGDRLRMVLRRNGESKSIAVTLLPRPSRADLAVLLLEQRNPPRNAGDTIQLAGGIVGGNVTGMSNFVVDDQPATLHGNLSCDWQTVLSFELTDRPTHVPLTVDETASLGGILYVSFGSYRPRVGDAIPLLTADKLQGRFGVVMLPGLDEGLVWDVVYDRVEDGFDLDRDGKADVTLVVRSTDAGVSKHAAND